MLIYLKLRPIQYDKFHCGSVRKFCSECLIMLIDVILHGSMPYSGSINNFTGFLNLISCLYLFYKQKIACAICGLRSLSFESKSVFYITPTDIGPMQE